MGDNHQIKVCRTGYIGNFLKTGKGTHVVVEVLAELIPDKQNGFEIVLFNDFSNPLAQFCRSSFKVALELGDTENFLHQGGEGIIRVGLQFFDNGIGIVAAEQAAITSLGIDIEALFVF